MRVYLPQRNAVTLKKFKLKFAKIRHVSREVRHLCETRWGKGFWDTILSSSEWNPDSKEKFISALQSKEVQHMNLAEMGDINEAVDKFLEIIEAAAKKKVVRHR